MPLPHPNPPLCHCTQAPLVPLPPPLVPLHPSTQAPAPCATAPTPTHTHHHHHPVSSTHTHKHRPPTSLHPPDPTCPPTPPHPANPPHPHCQAWAQSRAPPSPFCSRQFDTQLDEEAAQKIATVKDAADLIASQVCVSNEGAGGEIEAPAIPGHGAPLLCPRFAPAPPPGASAAQEAAGLLTPRCNRQPASCWPGWAGVLVRSAHSQRPPEQAGAWPGVGGERATWPIPVQGTGVASWYRSGLENRAKPAQCQLISQAGVDRSLPLTSPVCS